MEVILFIASVFGMFLFWAVIMVLWNCISAPNRDGTDVLVRMDTHFPAPMKEKK